MEKKQIRQVQLQKLGQAANSWAKTAQELDLYQQLLQTPEWQTAQSVGLVLSEKVEIDTKPLILAAQSQGKKVGVPKTYPDFQMEFIYLEKTTEIIRTKFGVLEPKDGQIIPKDQLDLIIVPGLLFTKQGDRVSFGGGFYDRYLQDYPGHTIALAEDLRLTNQIIWPVETTDIQIHKILTVGD